MGTTWQKAQREWYRSTCLFLTCTCQVLTSSISRLPWLSLIWIWFAATLMGTASSNNPAQKWWILLLGTCSSLSLTALPKTNTDCLLSTVICSQDQQLGIVSTRATYLFLQVLLLTRTTHGTLAICLLITSTWFMTWHRWTKRAKTTFKSVLHPSTQLALLAKSSTTEATILKTNLLRLTILLYQ